MALAADLEVQASIDLPAVFGDLAGAFTDVDFGDVRFDASAILDLVARAAPPDVGTVIDLVDTIAGQLGTGVASGLPGGELPGLLTQLMASLGQIGAVFPAVDVDVTTGLDGLGTRIGTVRTAVESGPLPALLGLVPGLSFPTEVARIGSTLGGLIDLVRTLAGLTATSAGSQRLVERAGVLARQLDVVPARAAGAELAQLVADTALVTALRSADPDDPVTARLLAERIAAFGDAVFDVRDRWATGMGFGEAALRGLDLTTSIAGLELARLTLSGVDLAAVGQMAADVRDAGRAFLDLELPVAQGAAGLVDQALGLVDQLVGGVEAWDAASLVDPLQRLVDLALAPLDEVSRAVETVANTAASAIRSVRQLVADVDLSSVADAIHVALQPVIDTLDAIDAAVGDAQAVLEEVAGNITAALGEVADAVATAATTVTTALGAVKSALDALNLAGLADQLGTALGAVAAALASAQLTPYFDAAIDVIDTGASVVDAVPFEMLPTDIQQEIVDVCAPIKALDLQPVEDTLRAELAEIRGTLREDALDAIAAVYAEVVDFLAGLDPEPPLVGLEAEPMQALRDALAAIDPESLLAPVTAAIEEMRAALQGVDVSAAVLGPLTEVFEPLLRGLAELDPAGLLAPITAEIDRIQQLVTDVLRLDEIDAALSGLRDRAADVLARIDPQALADVLDDAVASSIAALPAGPPGGAFGSLLVTMAQATGLDATEGAVADTIAWVGGRQDGSTVVRARLATVAELVAGTRDAVAGLDPGPLTAAASAQHRALAAALSVHAAESRLRLTLDPLLAGFAPADVLGPLAENRRRYLAVLDVAVSTTTDLAASGRSEVSAAAAELRAALVPLDAYPAKARALLGALGIDGADAPLRQLFTSLYEQAGPARLVPALAELATALRQQALAALDAVLQPARDAVAAVRGIVDAFDIAPIVDELVGLHAEVTAEITALTPAALLGPVLGELDAVIDRVAEFDPLAAVRTVIDEAKAAADDLLDSARPTIVFAPVIEMHHDVVEVASGLDVVTLLGPVIDALDAIGGQLDAGFDETIDALQRLQAALPSEVVESPLASVDVGVDVGFG